MTTFDENDLTPERYRLTDPIEAVKYQNVVERFMEIVRNDSAYLRDKQHLVAKFCRILDDDDAWELALMIVPELRLPQSRDTSTPSAMNAILKKLKGRRPQPLISSSNVAEKRLIKIRVKEAVDYLWKEGREAMTEEEAREAADVAERATGLIGKSIFVVSARLTFCADPSQSVREQTG